MSGFEELLDPMSIGSNPKVVLFKILISLHHTEGHVRGFRQGLKGPTI